MGYISGYFCDRYGKYGEQWLANFGVVFARKQARENGWQIGKMGWLCPECKKEVLDYANAKRRCDDGA